MLRPRLFGAEFRCRHFRRGPFRARLFRFGAGATRFFIKFSSFFIYIYIILLFCLKNLFVFLFHFCVNVLNSLNQFRCHKSCIAFSRKIFLYIYEYNINLFKKSLLVFIFCYCVNVLTFFHKIFFIFCIYNIIVLF